jgi:Leucine-rich repeat (LRR) protein
MKRKFTFFCLVFAFCANVNTTHAQVNVQDSLALVDLYNSANGSHWSRHENWLTKNPVSTWFGIFVTGTRVTSIFLNGDKLAGALPSSVGDLVNLEVLSLGQNQLSGSIPSSLGNLTKLRDLLIADNQLVGSIPSSVGNLVNLEELILSGNQLSGSIPSSLANLTNLINLTLYINQLSGSIPSSLGNLVNLQELRLDFNQLSGSIPSSLGKLINLQRLGMQHNQLSGGIPSSLGNISNLIGLSLNHNQLSGSIPSSLGNLANLDGLDIAYNQLSGNIPASLGNIVNLGSVDLQHNQLTGDIPSFSNLPRLGLLDLNNNRLSGHIPSSLGNLSGLSTLDLKNNQLSGSIPTSLGNLVHLFFLDLSINKLSGTIPSSLSNLVGLHQGYLHLRNNRFIFDGMELIAQTFSNAVYTPQKPIPVHQTGNTLSVSAGGTLSNNTYTWFFKGAQNKDTFVIKGDSVFNPKRNGTYRVKVTNSIATKLILHSDTIVYTAPSVAISYRSTLQRDDKTNVFNVYPNPAKDILHVETNGNSTFSLLDQSGRILLTSNINGKGSINISGRAAGLYYLKNNSSGSVQKVIIAR